MKNYLRKEIKETEDIFKDLDKFLALNKNKDSSPSKDFRDHRKGIFNKAQKKASKKLIRKTYKVV